MKIETWTRVRGIKDAARVTEGVFTHVAMTNEGQPRALDDDA